MRKDFHWLWVILLPVLIVLPAAAPAGGNILLMLAMPFVTAGEILRDLSLSGGMGNLAAIGLYILLCAAPLLLIHKGDGWKENALLVLASSVMFWVMWYLVNPGQMPAVMRNDVGKAIYVGAIYSVMVTWGIFKLMHKADRVIQTQIYGALRIFLIICAVQFAMEGVGFGLSAYRDQLDAIQTANTALTTQQLMPSMLFLTLEYCFGALENLIVAWILMLGVRLLYALEEDPYSEECHKMSVVIFKWCAKAIPLVAVINLILNLGQILLASVLVNINYVLRIPALSLAVTFGMMALTRLLGQGKALKDDNDLFI